MSENSLASLLPYYKKHRNPNNAKVCREFLENPLIHQTKDDILNNHDVLGHEGSQGDHPHNHDVLGHEGSHGDHPHLGQSNHAKSIIHHDHPLCGSSFIRTHLYLYRRCLCTQRNPSPEHPWSGGLSTQRADRTLH